MTEIWTGKVNRGGYSYTRGQTMDRRPALKGRPRYRLKDIRPTFDLDVTMELSSSKFNEWQTFWTGTTNRGANPFYMRLQLDALAIYERGDEVYEVSANQPWTAKIQVDGNWTVSLNLNAPWTLGYLLTACDVIYGGPITDLAPDDIYGGPITDLATTIIEPCDGVFGNE